MTTPARDGIRLKSSDPRSAAECLRRALALWEAAFRDAQLTADQRRDHLDRALAAADHASVLDAGCPDPLILKTVLLRMRAALDSAEPSAAHDEIERVRELVRIRSFRTDV